MYGINVAGAVQDNTDGTYIGQITVFKAASFKLHVSINGSEFQSSPFSPMTVSPADLYAPNSIQTGFVSSA